MALLRNREVQIMEVANHIDNSTFVVRDSKGETEYAKMDELEFTDEEYHRWVRSQIPHVRMASDAKLKELQKQKDEARKENEKQRQDEQKAVATQNIKPQYVSESHPKTDQLRKDTK